MIVHEDYNLLRENDIALVRIDYPLVDESGSFTKLLLLNLSFNPTGINLLEENKFKNDTIMPICLPPTKGFRDTGVYTSSISFKVSSFEIHSWLPHQNYKHVKEVKKYDCMTNNMGPEKFQRCANQWIKADSKEVEPDTDGTCIKEKGPPTDDLCTKYKKEVEKTRFSLFNTNYETLWPTYNVIFIRKKYKSKTKRKSLSIRRIGGYFSSKLSKRKAKKFIRENQRSLKDLISAIREEREYCFNDVKFDKDTGWCATCDVMSFSLDALCSKTHKPL